MAILMAFSFPISTFALELITDFEWLEPNNTIEVAVGEQYQIKFTCSNMELAFTSDYKSSWVHYDFEQMQHVVDSPYGYSIDEKGIIRGLVPGKYAIKCTGWVIPKGGADNLFDRWLYITIVSEDESESNNTLETANDVNSKINFEIYNISDIDFFKYTNRTLQYGDYVTFKVHYSGMRDNPFGYQWSIFSGTTLVSSGNLLSQDQECRGAVVSGNTIYFEVYYNQSFSDYFNYGEKFTAEVFVNNLPAGEIESILIQNPKEISNTIHYDMMGRRINPETKGFHIIRQGNSKIIKAHIK